MEIKNIPLAGGPVRNKPFLGIELIRHTHSAFDVKLQYRISPSLVDEADPRPSHVLGGEICFKHVAEYRFVLADFVYYDFEYPSFAQAAKAHDCSGLFEIIDSVMVRNMLDKHQSRIWEDSRWDFKKPALRHFSLWFTEYGKFDVISLDVVSQEIQLPWQPYKEFR